MGTPKLAHQKTEWRSFPKRTKTNVQQTAASDLKMITIYFHIEKGTLRQTWRRRKDLEGYSFVTLTRNQRMKGPAMLYSDIKNDK